MTETLSLTTRLGQRMTVFAGDHVGEKIAAQGLYEPEVVTLLLALLQRVPDAVVLDVGANLGNHTLAFATAAASVHAFEPLATVRALLERNVADNALDHVRIHDCALSDSDGEATLHIAAVDNLGASSLHSRPGQMSGTSVPCRRGDDLLAELGISRVDLIKIDVEGHEAEVLTGLQRTIERDAPVLVLEWTDRAGIARMRETGILDRLQARYLIRGLGSTHDRGFWRGRPLGWLRRRFERVLRPRRAALYPFDPDRRYRSLLLVPHDRAGLIDGLAPAERAA